MDVNTVASIATLLGIGARNLWTWYQRALTRIGDKVTEDRRVAFCEASQAISSGRGTQFALQFYTDAMLREADFERYLVKVDGNPVYSSLATRSSWVGTRIALRGAGERCVVVPSTGAAEPLDSKEVGEILAQIELRGLRVWNCMIFRPLNIDFTRTSCDVRFCADDFFRYRFTNGSLLEELAQALVNADLDVAKVIVDDELPRRRRYLPPSVALRNFDSRTSLAGVNVLCAFARAAPHNDFVMIIQRRSISVSTRQGALSVIPAGIHQAMTTPEEEVNLSRTIMRELFEEVFGGEEIDGGTTRLRSDWYEKASKPMRWLYKHAGAWSLILTGAGMSLLTGSLTFSALLVVRDQYFWERFSPQMRTNWESSCGQSPLVSTGDAGLADLLRRPDLTDYSLQALTEGLLVLRELDPDRVRIPALDRQPCSSWTC